MIKNFEKNIILTSQTPHNFAIFSLEEGESNEYYIIPSLQNNLDESTLYINGVDINNFTLNEEMAIRLDSNESIYDATFHLTAFSNETFDASINFLIYEDASLNSLHTTYSCNILNRPYFINNEINTYPTGRLQVEDETSYLILRSNPKFTGNIKLRADSKNKLFLDTFKVSDILSRKKYRRKEVSPDSTYAFDVRNVFLDLPEGELYKVGRDDILDVTTPKTDYVNQYDTTYNYGARILDDKLYTERFSSLAPLWINENVPDYYAIFRIDGPMNERTSNLSQKYIKNGEIIKSWGLKDNTKLGKYLRNHLNELEGIRSPVFLSLSDPRTNDPDPNTWYGVAVNKGIITGKSEIPYFFDKRTDNFTNMNAFLSEGFERNNLLCPNLINLEFLFDDEDVSTFEMNRYFGLYLSENKLYDIIYYQEDSSINVISLGDESVDEFFNSDIFDSSGNIVSQYSNRIFSINDVNEIKRIFNKSNIDGSDVSEINSWINKPGNNILTTNVEEVETNPFIVFNLNNKLKQGEHLRIIDKKNFKIWEAYGISYERLMPGESWSYAVKSDKEGYPTLHQTAFSVDGSIGDQIKAIESAFKIFNNHENTPFKPYIRKEKGLSIVLEEGDPNDFYFQRITGNIKKDGEFTGLPKNDDLNLFGVITPNKDDIEILSYDASYGPINFEFYGDRKTITVNFIDQESYNFYSIPKDEQNELKRYMYYYDSNDKQYKLFEPFTISTEVDHVEVYVDDPTSLEDRILLKTKTPASIRKNTLNVYDVYPLTISLLGINPVKDFDFKVYDSHLGEKLSFNRSEGYKSEQWYKREDDKKTYQIDVLNNEERIFSTPSFYEIYEGTGTIKDLKTGTTENYDADSSMFKFNTFDSSIKVTSDDILTRIRRTYLNDDKEYYSIKDEHSEENILDYYQDPSSSLKYSLTIPYVSKWGLLGDNIRGNTMRLLLDSSSLENEDVTPTNFIAYDDAFSDEISYPIFKYNNPGDIAWKSYIYHDVYDVIEYNNEKITLYDLFFKEPYLDVFSKYINYSNNTSDIKIRSSKVYYSDFKNSVDTISNGLKLSISVKSFASNILTINDWDRYKFSFISSPSVSRTTNYPLEVIVNENTKTILMIWYQGSDDLNYHRKYSEYTLPKGLLENKNDNISFNGPLDNSINNYFIKTPFLVRTNNISLRTFSKYAEGDTFNIRYDSSVSSPISQFNVHSSTEEQTSIFNLFRNAHVNVNNEIKIDGNYTFNSYNTFDPSGKISYGYSGFRPSYDTEITENVCFTYKHKENYYHDKTCDLDNLYYILNYNLVNYNIIRDDIVYTNTSFIDKPISIDINVPRKYTPDDLDTSLGIYTYNGWIRPLFTDIFKFSINEDEYIKELFSRDFIISNTKLLDNKNIQQLWYNTVVDEVTSQDLARGNAINFIPEFNVFKSSWDENFYILNRYNSEGDLTRNRIDGYLSSKDVPSFFGSRLVKIPDRLNLTDWDETNTSIVENEDTYILEFNLTSLISDIFQDEKIFTDNWDFGRNSSNLINDYIKNTIQKYYRIKLNSININVATKNLTGDDNILAYEQNGHVIQDDKNLNSSLITRDDNYIYQIVVEKNKNLSYYITFDVYRK